MAEACKLNNRVRVDLWAFAVWPTLVFVCLWPVLEFLEVDELVVAGFYDPVIQAFPLQHDFWTKTVLHDWGRNLLRVFGGLIVLLMIGSFFLQRLRPCRRVLVYLVVAISLSVGLVNLGKRVSNVDCPWDMQEYGGSVGHYHLFDAKPAGEQVGKCFPGGHSSGGFSLFALYFAGLALGVSRARCLLLAPLVIGSVFAIDQWARGAHFPSHDLTSAYLCWMLSLGIYWLMFVRGQSQPASVG